IEPAGCGERPSSGGPHPAWPGDGDPGRCTMMASARDFNVSTELKADLRQWRTRAAAVGTVGAILSAAGFFIAGPTQFYRSYLWAYIFVVALTVGPLA